MFHLGWFVSMGFSPKAWLEPWAGDTSNWMKPDLFIDLARAAERACFDFLMIEDTSDLPDTYGGSPDIYLRYRLGSPKLDPAVLVPYLTQATSKIGIITTLSTTEYPPFLLARLVNTLDHTTGGRVGWNIVTGGSENAALNYGNRAALDHGDRYDRADEFTEIVTRLWDSWPSTSFVDDRNTPMFFASDKIDPINFEGKFFSCRGPLNSPRSPQGWPVLCQAGISPRGRRFAGRWADTVIALGNNVDEMSKLRNDIRNQASSHGRNPDSIKVLFLINPIVDDTVAAAQERRLREKETALAKPELLLAGLSKITGIDFSKFPLDAPLEDLHTNGHKGMLARYRGKSPREIVGEFNSIGMHLTGTGESVSAEMENLFYEVGADGFLVSNRFFTRRYICEIVDGLVPALQKRGLTRTAYSDATLRGNLLSF